MEMNRLENYRSLLRIRQAAGRRDVNILGGVATVSFLALIALGLLERIERRSLYITAGMVVVFLLTSLMAWVKLQIVNGMVELVENVGDLEG
jgi:hypothetical protein